MSEWAPACMSAREYAVWRDGAEWARATAGVPIISVCEDCTQRFREAAERAGTCNATPISITEMRRAVLTMEGEERKRYMRRIQWKEAQQRRRDGVQRRYRTHSEAAALYERATVLREAGMTWVAIGALLGIKPSTIGTCVARHLRRQAA